MKKIKVVILAPSLYGKGGLPMHIRNLAKYLSLRGDIELDVVTIDKRNNNFEKGEFSVHRVSSHLPYPFSLLGLALSLRKKVINIEPDIVHAEGSFAPCSTAAALLRNKYPTLLTVLGVVVKETKLYGLIGFASGVLIHEPNERYVVAKIPHIIVLSSRIKNLIGTMTNSKIYVVPEGIEFEKIRDTQPHDLIERVDIFIAVGLIRLKGIDILIKAIPEVVKTIPDLKAYIAGSGEEEEALKSMVKKLGLESNVRFLGYISDEEEINRYYKACKIVVVPSRWDVEPFAPLNAAVAGKPAIVSDMCNSSVVEDGKTGFVFKSEDVEELSRKIVKLLTDDKLRVNMGKAAIEKVKEYEWSKIVDRKIVIYKEVIADFHERTGKK